MIGILLQKIEEDIVFNVKKLSECEINNTVKWIYGILRNGDDYRFRMCYHDGTPFYAGGNNVFSSISNLKTNILFMDYRDSKLEIDGSVNALLYSMAEEVFLTYNGKKIPIGLKCPFIPMWKTFFLIKIRATTRFFPTVKP